MFGGATTTDWLRFDGNREFSGIPVSLGRDKPRGIHRFVRVFPWGLLAGRFGFPPRFDSSQRGRFTDLSVI